MTPELILAAILLAVPFGAHFAIGVKLCGWRQAVGFYVCVVCLLLGSYLLAMSLK